MPNHCESDFWVHGSPKLIQEFIDFARAREKYHDVLTGKEGERDEPVSANRFIPYPQEFKDQDEKAAEAVRKMKKLPKKDQDWRKLPKDGFNSGGYEWCIANWGTKWGMYGFSEWKRSKRSAFIRFSSAWSPPIPVIHAMARRFPKLTFTLRYYERGGAFKGVLQVKGDSVIMESESKYHGNRGG